MDELQISGGKKLYGDIKIAAAKNAVLPIIACCIMIEGRVVLTNCEPLADIVNMLKIIESLGGVYSISGDSISIDCSGVNAYKVDGGLTSAIRSSVFILGSLISRTRHAEISYPGGCDIGIRPIDLHIHGLNALGVKICEEDGMIKCDGRQIHAATVHLDFPSVGATENLIMAAALTKGTTKIHNAAAEPEITDLQNFINACGGRVSGGGSNLVVVEGVEKLKGTTYSPIVDRIATGTYLIAGAMCGGAIDILNTCPSHLLSLTEKLRAAGATISEDGKCLHIESAGCLRALHKVETQPYPGFPTDLQAPLTAMLSASTGTSLIIENLFENRYKHVAQLKKMGANIMVSGRAAIIRGARLHGADVLAEDLRGGAALVLAGLAAEGKTTVLGVANIDRGYYCFEQKLSRLGGDIKRVKS